jgi:FKBP-type peptidyl-prolyl cis-trans isomerase FkpA
MVKFIHLNWRLKMSKAIREKRRAARAAKRRRQRLAAIIILVLFIAVILALNWDNIFSKNTSIGETNSDMITTSSGLQYQEITLGTGESAKAGDNVSVHYTGWLEDGTKFDSSVDRGQPFEFPLGNGSVIRGWDEGVAGMKVGGVRKLTIPPELGYGDQGAGGLIPPGATLIFEVELLAIKE